MAKQAKPKTERPKKEKVATAAVGPVEGTLEGDEDQPAVSQPTKVKKEGEGDKVQAVIGLLFVEIRDALTATSESKKQPRQLRWALKALDAAEDAATRHIQHNV